jgi:hypothetical protein
LRSGDRIANHNNISILNAVNARIFGRKNRIISNISTLRGIGYFWHKILGVNILGLPLALLISSCFATHYCLNRLNGAQLPARLGH